ncbi:type II toxin-antitoxin system HicA family toxin [Pollutimonas sp. H1-120]|uniref:hypothetical protein n=1 Tax=Pollutimonas sp. H1-120 TaxID=3148824 RepID=UPI003B52569C
MANTHELARGHKRLRALIDFAIAEGWHVKRTSGGHLKFTKAGYAPIYTSTTASDHRASLNAQAQIRRTDRQCRSILENLHRGTGHG